MAEHQGQRDGREGKNHHPVVHQERLPLAGLLRNAQGKGRPHRRRDRAQEGVEERDHRRLSQHRLLWQRRLRGGGGRNLL